jgi:hypothetical protein
MTVMDASDPAQPPQPGRRALVWTILNWAVSLVLLLFGVLFVLADAYSPLQSDDFAWRGWRNFAWIWMDLGLVTILAGVLFNPLILRHRPRPIARWWSYALFAGACLAALLGLTALYKDVTGEHDLKLGDAAATNPERLAHYERAAALGNATAAFNAALGYDNGAFEEKHTGVEIPRDVKKAATLYSFAADHGVPSAQLNLGLIYAIDYERTFSKTDREAYAKARALLRRAAQSPDAKIRTLVTDRYAQLCKLVADEDAFELERQIAEQDATACFAELAALTKANAAKAAEDRAFDEPATKAPAAAAPASVPALSAPAVDAMTADAPAADAPAAPAVAQFRGSPAAPPRPAVYATAPSAPRQPSAPSVSRSIPAHERRLEALLANARARDTTGETDRAAAAARATRAACPTQACVERSYASQEAALRQWDGAE